ncbi:hypothetical protein BASA81_013815 [Batrachochytrium salamandrivorans]|nr:hypothetical protein BASA81_013815 [Batrachochytrium salamandrivorans]
MDLYASCLAGLDQAIAKRSAAGFTSSYFLLDSFRTDGAPLQQVKLLKEKFLASPAGAPAVPEDANELVGLLIHTLRVDHTCIYGDEEARKSLVLLGQDALERSAQARKRPHKVKLGNLDDEDDELNTTQNHPHHPSSSSSSEGEDDEDEEAKEMDIQLQARKLLTPALLVGEIAKLSTRNQTRTAQFCKLLHFCATNHSPFTPDGDMDEYDNGAEEEDHCFNLAMFFAPMLAKPDDTAYLSIRHAKQVPALRLVLWVWIEHYLDISQALLGVEAESPRVKPMPASSLSASPGMRPFYVQQHLSGMKPRLSTSSAPSLAESKPKSGLGTASPSPLKRNSTLSSPLPTKRKVSAQDVEYLLGTSRVIQAFLSGNEVELVTEWLELQAAVMVDIPLEDAPTLVTNPTAPKWANEQRLEIEKRVLKKRLLQWDREFELAHQRKPTKEDRLEVKGVFTAYAAVKLLLANVKDGGNNSGGEDTELLEKKALQSVLKLFERDFADKMKRKVEFASDIAGREMEYTRYKELKERASNRE